MPPPQDENSAVEGLSKRFGNLDATFKLLYSMNARTSSDSEQTLVGSPRGMNSEVLRPRSTGDRSVTDHQNAAPSRLGLGQFSTIWKFLDVEDHEERLGGIDLKAQGGQKSQASPEKVSLDECVTTELNTHSSHPDNSNATCHKSSSASPQAAVQTRTAVTSTSSNTKQDKESSHTEQLAAWKDSGAATSEEPSPGAQSTTFDEGLPTKKMTKKQRKKEKARRLELQKTREQQHKRRQAPQDFQMLRHMLHNLEPAHVAKSELRIDVEKSTHKYNLRSRAEMPKTPIQKRTAKASSLSPTRGKMKKPITPTPAKTTRAQPLGPQLKPSPLTNHYVTKLNTIHNAATANGQVTRSAKPDPGLVPKADQQNMIPLPQIIIGHDWTPSQIRHMQLLNRLASEFPSDRDWLTSPSQRHNHTNSPNGLHIFVDASNIFIGFYEFMKSKYKVGRWTQSGLSFESLVLLMERRRPVARRVVAGSTPNVPAFDQARDIGYELNVLNKVQKARELTDRQRYFQHGHKQRREARLGLTDTSGPESSSDTPGSGNNLAVPTKAEKLPWVEQGVDELLHLKILESVCDAEINDTIATATGAAPVAPPTMVLATGDAALAEYSDGFLKQVERALAKGWRVELVGWKEGISQRYRDRKFLKKSQGRFRIVELDSFAEELRDD